MKLFRLQVKPLMFLFLMGGNAVAGELVYTPVNPNFGGNPFNAAPLLNAATAQNNFTDPAQEEGTAASFAERVDRLVLNSISNQILQTITDPSTGDLVPGTINTGINTVTISDLGTNLEVVIVNNDTGETTTVLIPQ